MEPLKMSQFFEWADLEVAPLATGSVALALSRRCRLPVVEVLCHQNRFSLTFCHSDSGPTDSFA